MFCSYDNCSKPTDSDNTIVCWLCLKRSHAICAGIDAKIADALNLDYNGLWWCCIKCRHISVEFYNFARGISSGISEIGRDMWHSYLRISRFY